MDPRQVRVYVIEPTLRGMEMYSEAACRLMMITAAHESHMGRWIVQRNAGPACGIFQIEVTTARDILGRYLAKRPGIAQSIRPPLGVDDITKLADPKKIGDLRRILIGDLHFSTAIARLKYWMSPEPLPHYRDIAGLADYYKRIYNTSAGKADVATVVTDYERYGIIA